MEWLGPVVSTDQMPQFEISYRQGKTEYLKVSLGAEEMLSPEMLPADLSKCDLVHLTSQSDVSKQLSFVQVCRQRGAKQISAGTYLLDADRQPQAVRALIEQTDYFFMNETEARSVFGSLESARTEPGKVLYVTLGPEGACIIQGDTSTLIPAVATTDAGSNRRGRHFLRSDVGLLAPIESTLSWQPTGPLRWRRR